MKQVPKTPIIGREAEFASARALLVDEAVPLLMLTSSGGVGKTLLAQTVGHPEWRASSVGIYRLRRDGRYAIGALLAGIVADV